jgi:hypothetical protein
MTISASAVLSIISLAFLSGCVSTQDKGFYLESRIQSPKVIAISGTRAPWVNQIKKRLKQSGFILKPMVSQHSVSKKVTDSTQISYNEASARYILHLDGYARMGVMHRCFGGGYTFDYISAELIDAHTNTTVMSFSDSGMSEGCQPMSGTLYGDLTNSVVQSWK